MTAAKNVREALEEVLALSENGYRVPTVEQMTGDDQAGWAPEQAGFMVAAMLLIRTHGPALLQLLSATAAGDAVLVAEVTGADEYGPMLAWHRHWVDCIGKKLYLKDSK